MGNGSIVTSKSVTVGGSEPRNRGGIETGKCGKRNDTVGKINDGVTTGRIRMVVRRHVRIGPPAVSAPNSPEQGRKTGSTKALPDESELSGQGKRGN